MLYHLWLFPLAASLKASNTATKEKGTTMGKRKQDGERKFHCDAPDGPVIYMAKSDQPCHTAGIDL